MDPFTTILRAIIGKKMVDSAKQAYDETRSSVGKFFSDWDASLKTNYKSEEKKNTARANADAVADLFEKNGTLNTDPLAGKRDSTGTADGKAETAEEGIEVKAPENTAAKEDDADVVTYTYKPGDTFGQVLLNLGLSDGSRLWGQGGDVEYYTQQLRDQDMLDARGNVKLGIPFKLRRRK